MGIKVFDINKTNILTDVEYSSNSYDDGFASRSVAPSNVFNTQLMMLTRLCNVFLDNSSNLVPSNTDNDFAAAAEVMFPIRKYKFYISPKETVTWTIGSSKSYVSQRLAFSYSGQIGNSGTFTVELSNGGSSTLTATVTDYAWVGSGSGSLDIVVIVDYFDNFKGVVNMYVSAEGRPDQYSSRTYYGSAGPAIMTIGSSSYPTLTVTTSAGKISSTLVNGYSSDKNISLVAGD